MNSKSVGHALQLRPAGSLLRALRTFRSNEIHCIDETAHYFSFTFVSFYKLFAYSSGNQRATMYRTLPFRPSGSNIVGLGRIFLAASHKARKSDK